MGGPSAQYTKEELRSDPMNTNNTRLARAFAVCVIALLFAACGQQEQATTGDAATGDAASAAKVPLTTSSDAARALYLEGQALADNLRAVEAQEKFAQAVAADPAFAMGYYNLAFSSQSTAEFFDAVGKAAENAAGASEGEQLFIASLVAVSENDQAAQLAALNELVALYPGDERVHMLLGNYFNGQQDFATAAEHFGHATQINSEFAGAYNSLGYAQRSLEDFEGAKASFAKYVELLPDESNPYDSYAELLMEMGDYDASIENYRKALDIDPYFAASYAGITINESLKGNADLAQEAADQMLAAARNFGERQGAMFRSVTSHLFAGDIEAAMEVCNVMLAEAEVAGNKAAMGGIHEYMGDIMLVQGDAASGEEHYNAALDNRLAAGFNEANKAQAERTHMFKTAIAAMIADDAEAAASRAAEYSAAAEMNGTAFEKRRIHELAGYLAMNDEDFQSAVQHFDQANQLDPILLYWSASANAELGNTERAIDLATRAANRNTLSGNLPFFREDAQELLAKLTAE
jgi:tetratricopeptide (TPR) repeat protein